MDRKEFLEELKIPVTKENKVDLDQFILDSLEAAGKETKMGVKINVAIQAEECNELAKELIKVLRNKTNTVGILEEMADVYIGLKYLEFIFAISDEELAKAIQVKLRRAKKKLDEGTLYAEEGSDNAICGFKGE